MSVGRTNEADRVGYSPFSKPLAVEGYLLQQMPERGRCFSSSMRQIPRVRFILYLYSYLFIPAQLGASQRNTYTMGPTRVTMCICAVEAMLLWEGEGLDKGMVSIIHNLSKRPSTQGDIVCNFVGKQEKKKTLLRTCRGGCLPLWDCMQILQSWKYFNSEAWFACEN